MADRRAAWWWIASLLGCAACGDPSPQATAAQSAETEAPEPPRKPVEYWAERLNDPSANVRREALGNLGGYGRDASAYGPIIVPLLSDPDTKTGFTAAWALAHLGMGAHPLLIARLDSPSAEERERAAYGVGEMGPAGAVAADRLKELQKDSDAGVRDMATWALDQVTNRRMVADPNMLLLQGIRGTRGERFDAIDRLGLSAHTSRVAVRELVSLLGDSVPDIRARAVEALAQAGPVALPSLSAALSHRNREIRRGAMLAISRMHRVF